MKQVRGKAINFKDCTVWFRCPTGHVSRKDFSKGKPSQMLPSVGVALLYHYWKDSVTFVCKRCGSE